MTRTKSVFNLSTGEETVVPFTDDENVAQDIYERDVLPGILLDKLRRERNRLLTETDYLALSDQTLTAEMAAYRQALRDLPANTVDPANPVWPTKPGGAS